MQLSPRLWYNGIMGNGPINEILSGASETNRSQPPTVGMGATQLYISDRHACTVIEVSRNGKRVVVQNDRETRTDRNGFSEIQTWEHERNPRGPTSAYTLRKGGRWVLEGASLRSGQQLLLGERMTYWDPSF